MIHLSDMTEKNKKDIYTILDILRKKSSEGTFFNMSNQEVLIDYKKSDYIIGIVSNQVTIMCDFQIFCCDLIKWFMAGKDFESFVDLGLDMILDVNGLIADPIIFQINMSELGRDIDKFYE
jgi:hypothetical protein